METIPRKQDEQCQFDALFKTVLLNEARDYLREMKYRRNHETSLKIIYTFFVPFTFYVVGT